VSFSPSDGYLLSSSPDKAINIWSVTSGRNLVRTLLCDAI
jgi:WD40 repeat protein